MAEEHVVVVGQGYVGLPLAVRAAESGFRVTGLEIDERKVARLAAGQSPVEDVSDVRLAAAIACGAYEPVTALPPGAVFDFAVISVPTPLRDGAPFLGFVEDASRSVAGHLRVGACVILESTTYPGTTEELVRPILEEVSGLRAGLDIHLGYSPERIDPGNASWSLENTPKVVSGVNGPSLRAVQAFYDRIVDKTVAVSGCKEAELTKLLENTFRHVNIALVNELAIFAHELGIDIWEAIDAATTKPFGYMRFTPGPGVGGHCLPIDPSYLSWHVRQALGHSFRFVELANDVNDHMPDYVVQRIVANLNERELSVKGRRILLLGVAYKKNTGDARETPARRIASALLDLGATVQAADPHVEDLHFPAGVQRVEPTEEVAAGADLVVLLVDHDAFDLEALSRATNSMLDTRHALYGPNVEQL